MIVTLSPREIAMGASCGAARNIAALGRPDANGLDVEHGWNVHIEGACGEIAAAKFMGRYWSPTVNTFHAADIGAEIQVRTRSRHDYDLIVRDDDDPAHCFVLVTGKAPRFFVRGYMIGADAQRDEWRAAHGGRPPAWFVPQSALLPIGDLVRPAARVG